MLALNRKLLRDLRTLKGQVLSIAVVVACGIACYVALESSRVSLDESKRAYYERYRFGDVFARLVRAPEAQVARIEAIEGVETVYTRVIEEVMLPMASMDEPPSGRIVSLPRYGQPALNAVHLRAGRFPDAGTTTEVVVAEAFAKAHGLRPGDPLPAIINGARRELTIVGIGLSPEYVFSLMPTDISAEDKRFGILWMPRPALAAAFQMEGAFNDVTVRLSPGASELSVREALDQVLEPYGGFNSIGRDRQISNYILEGELDGLEQFASVAPIIFLAVAAFLLNVVLSQLVLMQRQQIAALRAVGYGKYRVVLHYLELSLIIVAIGSVLGVGLGAYFGKLLTGVYARFFTFPVLVFAVAPKTALVAIGVSVVAAVVGAFASVLRVARLPPAEALRPPAAPSYRRSLLSSPALTRWLGPTATMVARELTRRPLRLLLSSLGVGAAIGVVVVGRFSHDAFESLIHDSLERERAADVSVTFHQPVNRRVLGEFRALPGVDIVEGHRVVGARFESMHRHRDGTIFALASPPRLRRLVDLQGQFVEPSESGLTISRKLAELLDVSIGDSLRIELLTEERHVVHVPIDSLVDDAFGLQGYLSASALARLLGEPLRYSNLEIAVAPRHIDSVLRMLANSSAVASVTRPARIVQSVRDRSGESMRIMTIVLSIFGIAIAVGVVYNNARVALAHRRRDLASLRVLGFTRREISSVLLGELAVQMVLALPIGALFGRWWASALMSTADPETYRLPATVTFSTYVFAMTIAVAAGLVSALLVRRKLDRLDLIAVLKTRE